jgi:chromosomal replication initiator protein
MIDNPPEIQNVVFQTPVQDPMRCVSVSCAGWRFPPVPATVRTPVPARNRRAAPRTRRCGRAVPLRLSAASQLNPKYQFDAFVIGSNQPAMAAAQAVAERPSRLQPLSSCMAAWGWQAHLMHAIGHDAKRRQPHASISYVSGEKFTNDDQLGPPR